MAEMMMLPLQRSVQADLLYFLTMSLHSKLKLNNDSHEDKPPWAYTGHKWHTQVAFYIRGFLLKKRLKIGTVHVYRFKLPKFRNRSMLKPNNLLWYQSEKFCLIFFTMNLEQSISL